MTTPETGFAAVFKGCFDRRSAEYAAQGRKFSINQISEGARIGWKTINDYLKGTKKPNMDNVVSIARYFGLGPADRDSMLAAAGYEPLGFTFDDKVMSLREKLDARCKAEIPLYEARLGAVDIQFPELSAELKQQIKEEYEKRLERAKSAVLRFDAMQGKFNSLASMSDTELCRENSNAYRDFSGFPEEFREDANQRKGARYAKWLDEVGADEAVLRTEYPCLYAGIMAGRGQLTLGQLLRKHRGAEALKDFAARIRTSDGYLSRLERDLGTPTEKKLKSIAASLKLNETQTAQLLAAASYRVEAQTSAKAPGSELKFGRALAVYRSGLGFSPEEAAQLAGMDPDVYSSIESGKVVPDLETARKLAAELCVADDLLKERVVDIETISRHRLNVPMLRKEEGDIYYIDLKGSVHSDLKGCVEANKEYQK